MYWIYKCNSRNHPDQVVHGDWNYVFERKGPVEWGSTKYVPGLLRAQPGDIILAHQTDRNELVGIARVERHRKRGKYIELMIKPVRRIGKKVRPMKEANKRVAAIPALKAGPIRTLYPISEQDMKVFLRTAGVPVSKTLAKRQPRESLTAGGGFGIPKNNKKVEAAAMRIVSKDYGKKGWSVLDVSRDKRGFDLLCWKGNSVENVEVKGVSGDGLQFFVTKNERARWRTDKDFVLAVVTGIKSSRPQIRRFAPRSVSSFSFDAPAYIVRMRK